MQINFECIFKLIVALTFLMCAFFALSVYVLHYIIIFVFFFFFFFFCFIFLNQRQQKGRKKKETKNIKKVNSRMKFSIWKPFWSNYFFRLINQGNGFCY